MYLVMEKEKVVAAKAAKDPLTIRGKYDRLKIVWLC